MSENDVESDVRVSMSNFTKILLIQFVLTILTGKALPNQNPLFKSNAATQFTSSVVYLVFGVVGSFIVWNFLPISVITLFFATWLFTVAGARKFQTEIHHQIVHYRFSGNANLDRVLAEVLSTVLFTQDYTGYKIDHPNHHSKNLATTSDPDAQFLYYLGFKPGMTKSQLWKRLVVTILSPKYHLTFLFYRFKANFITAPFYRKVMSFVWITVLGILTAHFGLATIFVTVIVPLTVLYQISSLWQFLTEHRWFRTRKYFETQKNHIEKLTVGRFFGEVYPVKEKIIAKFYWILKMIFYHGVLRLFVCPGTLPVHDAHHRMPGTKDWGNLIFVRQQDIDKGCGGWSDYEEVWGLFNMIDKNFEHFASLPEIDASGERICPPSPSEILLGM